MALQKVDDHIELASARLLTQYQRPKMQALVAGISQQVQQLEDAFFSLLDAFNLNTATGAQLTQLAALLGLDRYGLSDDQLRVLLRGVVALRNGSATSADIVAVTMALFQTKAVFFSDGTSGKHSAQVARGSVFLSVGASSLPEDAIALARSLIGQAFAAGVELVYLARMDSVSAFACQGPQQWVAGYASVATPTLGGKFAGLSDSP